MHISLQVPSSLEVTQLNVNLPGLCLVNVYRLSRAPFSMMLLCMDYTQPLPNTPKLMQPFLMHSLAATEPLEYIHPNLELDVHSNNCGGLAGFSAILVLCKILQICAQRPNSQNLHKMLRTGQVAEPGAQNDAHNKGLVHGLNI